MQAEQKKDGGRRVARHEPGSRGVADLLHEIRAQRQQIAVKERELAQTRAKLEQTILHFADLYENVPIAYVTLDSYGLIADCNSTSAKLFGLDRERLLGRSFSRFVSDEDHLVLLEHMRRCRHEGSSVTEISLDLRSEPMRVGLDSRRIPREPGEGALYRTAVVDLRQRVQMEAARRQAEQQRLLAEEQERRMRQANEAKDRFIAELSHELRTPLTPILAAVSGLGGRADVPDFLRPTVDMIGRNVQVEARLIDDLLDVSRIGRDRVQLERRKVDAHEILRDVATTLGAEITALGIRFTLELNARDSVLLADPLRLGQIFWNLISNALRNTPRGGSVTVSSSNMDRDLRVIVRDTGRGISRDRLEEIFRPFSQGRTKGEKGTSRGLGLGLAIVKGLVEAHGGRIRAFSEGPGAGSTFVLETPTLAALPAAERLSAVSGPRETEVRRQAAAPSRCRVLLVEDHADTREALQTFLELKGYAVKPAADMASALAAAREPVDVLVCDVGLPDGSGLDLLKRISAEKPVKAIALTGYGTPRDVALSSAAGFAAHLTKPVTAEKLLQTIESVLRG